MKRSSKRPLKPNSTKFDIEAISDSKNSKKIQRKSTSRRISNQFNVRNSKFRSKAVTSSCISNNVSSNNSQLTNGSTNQEAIGCDINEIAIVRNLISTITIHPTLLVHSDFASLRNYLKRLGVIFSSDTTDIIIPIGPAGDAIGKGEKPFLLSFGFVRDMDVDPIRQIVTIRQFSLTESMKKILNNVLLQLFRQPEIVYKPPYTFLYEFFINFGVSPTVFSNFAQRRES